MQHPGDLCVVQFKVSEGEHDFDYLESFIRKIVVIFGKFETFLN